MNPAVWEISGHLVLKRRKDFDDASEAYAWKLLSEVSLSEERFQEVKAYVVEAAGLCETDVELMYTNKGELVQNYESTTPLDCVVQH